MNILEVKDLHKSFGSNRALDGVTFNVRRGSICGLLGPNGAGKTTLLRIINSILVPDSGQVLLHPNNPSSQLPDTPTTQHPNTHNNSKPTTALGYMPEERGLYEKMRVEDQIMFFGRLKGGDPRRLRQVMDEYLELFNLSDDRRRRIKELSKGNQQKVQIIATIVHEPELVILDEPFSGFDPINGAILQELIGRLHDRGTTVMLSSHNMNAIEEICDDIALINKGRMLVNDSLLEIKDRFRDGSLLLTTSSPLDLTPFYTRSLLTPINPNNSNNLNNLNNLNNPNNSNTPSTQQPSSPTPQPPNNPHRKGYTYRLFPLPGVRNVDILDMAAYQADILHFEEALPSLQEIFLRLVRESDKN